MSSGWRHSLDVGGYALVFEKSEGGPHALSLKRKERRESQGYVRVDSKIDRWWSFDAFVCVCASRLHDLVDSKGEEGRV